MNKKKHNPFEVMVLACALDFGQVSPGADVYAGEKEIDLLSPHAQNPNKQKIYINVCTFIWVSPKQKLAYKNSGKIGPYFSRLIFN